MPRKKKGKGSKFARMSDEERARYLQHRADLELEAKRRKQQLIAIFTKNKLKREEVFSRINTAKINERWRSSLRKLKCTELKEDVEQLWKNFEGTLKTKDDFIKQLFSEIAEADIDHHRFQEAHIMVVDDILEKGKERIKYLNNNYLELVRRIKTNDIDDLKNVKMKMKESLLHLETVIFGQNKLIEEELMELKTRNAVNIYNIVFSKEQSMLRQEREIYPRIECLRRELNGITTNYENSTDSKRKQYEYLKEQDDAYQEEAALFPKLFLQMKQNAENLRKKIVALSQEREETIEDLKLQSDLLNKRVCKMRQEVKMAQTIDAVQLKQLSVLSNKAIKKLERNLNNCGEVQMMTKLCSDLESESVNVQKYILKNLQTPRDSVKADNKSSDYLKKVQGFKDYLYFIKEENNLIKQNLNNLIEENSRLKHSLRSYLISVSRMPTIRPCTRA